VVREHAVIASLHVLCPCSIFCDSVTLIYACIIIIIIIIIIIVIIIMKKLEDMMTGMAIIGCKKLQFFE